jgi:hypothetical protein
MSKYLAEEWSQKKVELAVRFAKDPRFQLNAQDEEAISQARDMIVLVREYKVCHYASCALFESGKHKCGTHIYCRRKHGFSLCAESRPMERTHFKSRSKQPDPIETLATFHAGYDKYGKLERDPYLSAPCEQCVRLLNQVSPDCLIVTDLDDKGTLAKIPLEAVDYFRHPTKHNGE